MSFHENFNENYFKALILSVGIKENNFCEPKEIWEEIIKKIFYFQLLFFKEIGWEDIE